MAVVDSLVIRKGSEFLPIDSYNDQTIDEIAYEGQSFHFAKQKDLTRTSEIVADNGVVEPIISLGVSGATLQDGTPTPEAPIPIQNTNDNFENLFDIDSPNIGAGSASTLTNYSPKIENGIIYGGGVGGTNEGAYVYVDVSKYSDIEITYNANIAHRRRYVLFDNVNTSTKIFTNTKFSDFMDGSQGANKLSVATNGYKYLGIACYKTTQYDTQITDLYIHTISKFVLHGKNLATAQQVCKKFRNYKELEYEGRQCVSYTQNNYAYFVLEGGFKENTQYTISFDVTSIGSSNNAAFYFLYDGINPSNDDVVSAGSTGIWKSIKKTSRLGKTIKGIGLINADSLRTIYIDVNTFMLQEGAIADPVYEPYFRETIEIPTSIDVDGTNVPLLFSEYDKLTVDRVSNKVVYINGTYVITYDENKINTSNIYLNPQVGLNFYFHRVTNSTFLVNGKGLSTHFPRRPWYPLQTNYSFGALSDNNYTNIAFRLTGTETLAEFKQFMIDIANTGNPVIVQAQRFTPIEYDITSTDLGQSLLALATRKGTNIFEISSDLAPSQTDLSYWRQIIPNE